MKRSIIMKEMGSELLLYDIEQDSVHILNAAAGMIYRLLNQAKGIDAIEQAVSSRFRLEGSQDVRKDIVECIGELERKGLMSPALLSP